MAAPTPTVRGTPPGFILNDGFPSFIAFASIPQLLIWEKQVQPPGIDGGDPIDTNNMHNDEWRTMAPRALKTLSPFTVVAGYDPGAYTELEALVNDPEAITVIFPDTSTLAFWGYLQKVEFSPMVEGTQPECTLTIVPTNYDPDNCVPAGPVLDAHGTC